MPRFFPDQEVYLIHSRQFGWIIEAYDEDSWLVEVDGDEIPIHDEDLLSAEEAPGTHTERPLAELSVSAPVPVADEKGPVDTCYQLFEEEHDGRFRRWLVNGTTLHLELLRPGSTSRVPFPPTARLEWGSFDVLELNDQENSPVTWFWQETDVLKRKVERSFQKDIRVRVSAFVRALQGMREKGQSHIIFPVFHGRPPVRDVPGPPPPEHKASARKRLSQNPVRPFDPSKGFAEEIDLHAEKILEHPEKYHPAEILPIQLSRAVQYLDRAVVLGVRRVYLIHGVGSGRLRESLHEWLGRHPHVAGFRNTYFPRYGFGATEVDLAP